jgi:general secretion pathway protein E
LSTLHTNSAIGAITRLRDMGVEPFLLSSSLIGVMAQRLVRRLCPACRKPHTVTNSEREWLNLPADESPTIYAADACSRCNQLGYAGRTGVYEFISIDDHLQDMIHDGAGEHAMELYARKFASSLRQDGRRLILEGVTSLEEVLRVSRDDS